RPETTTRSVYCLFYPSGCFTNHDQLTEADQAVFTFAAGLSIFTEFRSAIAPRTQKTTTDSLCKLLAHLTGIKEGEFHRALQPESPLVSTGLVKLNKKLCDLDDKLELLSGMQDVMLKPHKNADSLMSHFLRRVAPTELALENFPHLKRERDLLLSYLQNAVRNQVHGVNILVHGKPGVGKNQFVQAMAEQLDVELFEVTFADKDGDPIKGEYRLRAYAFCQRLLARNNKAMILFDEIEDVFGSGINFFSMLFGGDGDEGAADGGNLGKAWINRTMENNSVPAIWISNKVGQIDKAYLRRFDYSVAFPTPPQEVRVSMALYHLDSLEPPQGWIERLAANEEITPAQFERAAKVAKTGSPKNKAKARELVEQVLERSTSLLGQRRRPQRNVVRTGYSLEWLNTDLPIAKLVEGIKRRPMGTFCFYGAAGTGKSELARYMADQIGKPMVVKRASDILSMYVGQSEQNIAAMFNEARQQDAVLVLDEADSFLADRRDARNSWEVTQANELLTQMEAFEGIFICTTNLMNKLDQASLRRFAFKVRFDPLKPEQRVALFRQELVRLGGDEAECSAWELQVTMLEKLTPGDFAVASRQFELWDEPVTAVKLYGILKKECEAKGASPRKIGFGV
ncbi:AAA family ATPase, partial [Trichlorobacter lovleyi]|uniref:AAA family ATPase n=1 Tax=Trichlorobacter lovleyi TaxID=313985 RepID=UPI003D140744